MSHKFFIKLSCILSISVLIISCVSTRNTIKNIDNSVLLPKITKENTFYLTEFSKDAKYGYDKDYPINVFYLNANDEELNPKRYLNALSGPNGEVITYKKTGICCPFPSKNINTGGGVLDMYEINYSGLKNPITLYVNRYEKGALLVPIGLGLKK